MDALGTSPPAFRESLRFPKCGSSDTGHGLGLTDTAIINLVTAIPTLNDIALHSATNLTDAAITAILQHSPSIKHISITGNDKSKGRITGRETQEALEDKKIEKKLRYLDFVDQNLDTSALKTLSKARPALTITEGHTVGEGPAAQYLAEMFGGGKTTTWMGGRMVEVQEDNVGYDGYEDHDDYDEDRLYGDGSCASQ